MVNRLKANGVTRLLGGNCAGIITPGQCKMGIMPGHIFTPGDCSGLGKPFRERSHLRGWYYEMTQNRVRPNHLRRDRRRPDCPGTRFIEVMQMFEADPATKSVVLIGEIGSSDEEVAAEYIKKMTKPVVAFISGRTAPPGKRMGHAGAIISGNSGTARSKVAAIKAAGVPVADRTMMCRGSWPKLWAECRRACSMPARRTAQSGSPFEASIGFSRALRVGAITTVSGTAPVNPDGTSAGIGDPSRPGKAVPRRLSKAALRDVGVALQDVIRTRMYLTRTEDADLAPVGAGSWGVFRSDSARLDCDGRCRATYGPEWRVKDPKPTPFRLSLA